MTMCHHLRTPAIISAILSLLALTWLLPPPWQPIALLRIDALTIALTITLLLAAIGNEQTVEQPGQRWINTTLLAIALCTTSTPAIIVAFIGIAWTTPPAHRRTLHRLLLLCAASALFIGYGRLALRGAWSYDRTNSLALDSFAFWYTLLAALLGTLSPTLLIKPTYPTTPPHTTHHPAALIWLYPLTRLYSIGPWNNGWHTATLLLTTSIALWAAITALTHTSPPARWASIHTSTTGLALIGIGLGTNDGLNAGFYTLLVATLLGTTPTRHHIAPTTAWTLSGTIPLTAPFVATWMLISATRTADTPILTGIVWLIALLNALAATRPTAPPTDSKPTPLTLISSALGLIAPLIAPLIIHPLTTHLQNGLRPTPPIAIWSWGTLPHDANQPTAPLHTLAIAGLMLILTTLTLLIARTHPTPNENQHLPPRQPTETTT